MSEDMERNSTPEQERLGTAHDAVEPAISPGGELARRRQELNLTVEQVAAQLNLAPRQVEAIEADNFAALPGMAIARGFVRSYAKLVRVDAEPLLAAMAPAVAPMPDRHPVKQTYVNKPLSADRLSFGENSGRKSKVLWIVLLVVVVGIAFAAVQQMGPISLPAMSQQETTPEQGSQPAGEPQPQGQAVEVLPAPDITTAPAPETPPAAAPDSTSGAQAAPPAVAPVSAAASGNETRAAVSNENMLVLRAREQSWIELKRADGAILAARLFEAGTEESFPVNGGLALVVGNASGVDAVLNGEPLDLQAKARANVARIKVK